MTLKNKDESRYVHLFFIHIYSALKYYFMSFKNICSVRARFTWDWSFGAFRIIEKDSICVLRFAFCVLRWIGVVAIDNWKKCLFLCSNQSQWRTTLIMFVWDVFWTSSVGIGHNFDHHRCSHCLLSARKVECLTFEKVLIRIVDFCSTYDAQFCGASAVCVIAR